MNIIKILTVLLLLLGCLVIFKEKKKKKQIKNRIYLFFHLHCIVCIT